MAQQPRTKGHWVMGMGAMAVEATESWAFCLLGIPRSMKKHPKSYFSYLSRFLKR